MAGSGAGASPRVEDAGELERNMRQCHSNGHTVQAVARNRLLLFCAFAQKASAPRKRYFPWMRTPMRRSQVGTRGYFAAHPSAPCPASRGGCARGVLQLCRIG